MEHMLKFAPLFGAVSALVGACALGVATYQLRSAIRWNRLQAAFTYFPNPLSLEALENELDETIRFWSRKKALSDDECRLLLFQAEMTDLDAAAAIQAARETLRALGREPPTDNREFLLEMRKTGRKLKAYVNEVERYSAAVNSGVVDDSAAKHIYSAKFQGHYERLRELIKLVQKSRGDTVYHELGVLADRWKSEPGGMPRGYP